MRDATSGTPDPRSDPGGVLWVLSVPYEERKEAGWAGARWNSSMRRWVYDGDELPAALDRWAPPRHSWERWVQDDLNRRWDSPRLDEAVSLRPHQEVAAEAIRDAWVESRPGFLLADQTGIGKTYGAIAGVNAIGQGMNVLVVSPLSVVPHWRRSIDALGGQNRWCVINYDRLKSLLEVPASAAAAKRTRTKNKRIATQGRSIVEWDVILVDEAHMVRNLQSQRAAALRQLVKSHGTPAFCVWMSATAGQNPLELAYLAPLVASVTGAKVRDLADFEQWCRDMGFGVKRGPYGSWLWERNPDDLSRMRELLFEGDPPAGLRRRPTDIAGWPEQQRIPWSVELDAHDRRLYDQAWDDFRTELALDASGSESANALVAALRFRQKASLLRAPHTAAFVADLVDGDLQVAVSVQFHETAEAIRDALARQRVASVTISGREGADEREQNRIAFQRGEVPVVLFTVCEGISLHANEQASAASSTERALVAHDLRWSAIQMAQVEGRTHRDGQASLAYYLFAAGTVEEKVAAAMVERLEDMQTMMGDDTTGLDALMSEVSAEL